MYSSEVGLTVGGSFVYVIYEHDHFSTLGQDRHELVDLSLFDSFC